MFLFGSVLAPYRSHFLAQPLICPFKIRNSDKKKKLALLSVRFFYLLLLLSAYCCNPNVFFTAHFLTLS
jgi:hypothetical protein